MHRFESLALLGVVLCAFTVPGFAQSERGTISGTIHDSSGAIVPGASIKITNTDTNVTLDTASNSRGEFTAPSLPPSTYTIRVEKPGFRPSEETGLTLVAGGNVQADATLQVGAATQAVEVSATAVQLSTEDSKTSVTLENRLVQDLPLEVAGSIRGPFQLAGIAPDAKSLGGTTGFSIGGGQAASYGTSLDGISANTSRALYTNTVSSNAPSVEAIDQFSIDSSGYKAEFGHAAGNLTFASKSGGELLPRRCLLVPSQQRSGRELLLQQHLGHPEIRFTNRTISALRSAVRSGSRRSTKAKTRPSSSSRTKGSATARALTGPPTPSRRRKCITGISPTG